MNGNTNKYEYNKEGNHYIIITKKGERILIDADDFDKVKKHSWCINRGRVVANIKCKVVYLHRFILGIKNGVIDHINGVQLDNRKRNLRITDRYGNARNNNSHNKYGCNGIRKTAAGKYNARITYDYKEIHIGNYKTLEEAIENRKKYEELLFKEYAPSSRVEIKPQDFKGVEVC